MNQIDSFLPRVYNHVNCASATVKYGMMMYMKGRMQDVEREENEQLYDVVEEELDTLCTEYMRRVLEKRA